MPRRRRPPTGSFRKVSVRQLLSLRRLLRWQGERRIKFAGKSRLRSRRKYKQQEIISEQMLGAVNGYSMAYGLRWTRRLERYVRARANSAPRSAAILAEGSRGMSEIWWGARSRLSKHMRRRRAGSREETSPEPEKYRRMIAGRLLVVTKSQISGRPPVGMRALPQGVQWGMHWIRERARNKTARSRKLMRCSQCGLWFGMAKSKSQAGLP